jgi:hypothetical protein
MTSFFRSSRVRDDERLEWQKTYASRVTQARIVEEMDLAAGTGERSTRTTTLVLDDSSSHRPGRPTERPP